MSRQTLAAVLVLLGPLAVLAAAPPTPVPAVVPAPVTIAARPGSFQVTRSTPVVVEAGDVGAQRVAANFADLLSRSHGVRLQVRNDKAPRAIVLRRARDLPDEGYRIEVDARAA